MPTKDEILAFSQVPSSFLNSTGILLVMMALAKTGLKNEPDDNSLQVTAVDKRGIIVSSSRVLPLMSNRLHQQLCQVSNPEDQQEHQSG
jgi:hypothetical protein